MVPGIGTRVDGAAWEKVAKATSDRQVLLDTHASGGAKLEKAKGTLRGSEVFKVTKARDGDGQASKVETRVREARHAAKKELRAFLGNFAEGAFAAAGIRPNKPLLRSQVRAALDYVGQHARDLDAMLADPAAHIHNTKLRDLRLQHAASNNPNRQAALRADIASLEKFTVGTHVQRVSDAFATRFAPANATTPAGRELNVAMEAAIKVKVLSQKIAGGDLNNPRARDCISDQLFKAHAQSLPAAGTAEGRLARQLARNDTLMKALMGKLDAGSAAAQVREMARAAKIEPTAMLAAMRQLLECELASFSPAEIAAADLVQDSIAPGGTFKFDDVLLVGDITQKLFKRLVGDGGPRIDDHKRLEFADEAKGVLQAVDKAVGRKPRAGAAVDTSLVGQRGVTPAQNAFLQGVRATEAALLDAVPHGESRSPRAQVLAHFEKRYDLSTTEAGKVLAKVEEWFKTAPLTITFKAGDLFQQPTPKFGTRYMAAQEIGLRDFDASRMSELVGGAGTGDALRTPSTTETGARGVNYLRWRMEKDDAETRFSGLGPTEQAVFGAVNINFGKTRGFEGDASAYGESHLVLKDEVRERAVFNFNKTREPRAGATMILYDMLHDRNGSGTKGEKHPFIDAMVHNALGLDGMVKTSHLQLEVQVFGELDMLKDVHEVRLPADGFAPQGLKPVDGAVRANVKKFFRDNGVKVRDWDGRALPAALAPGGDALKQAVADAAKVL